MAYAPGYPFTVLLEQNGADETCDGCFVQENAANFHALLVLAVEAFERVGAVRLRSVLHREFI
jgi:hypothetical protein